MRPQEFKAWFDGFTEAFDKAPTQKQWARIKERVAEIDGQPVTERVYVDRYWPSVYPTYVPPYQPYFRPGWTCSGGSWSTCQNVAGAATLDLSSYHVGETSALALTSFDSLSAMQALGQAEAANMASA